MFRTIGSRFSGTAVSPHKNIHPTLEMALRLSEYYGKTVNELFQIK